MAPTDTLEGCIAVGLDRAYATLTQSRAGLIALMARLDTAHPIAIVVRDSA
jgi:hypothetical protein